MKYTYRAVFSIAVAISCGFCGWTLHEWFVPSSSTTSLMILSNGNPVVEVKPDGNVRFGDKYDREREARALVNAAKSLSGEKIPECTNVSWGQNLDTLMIHE